jgi:hypothetical protein
MTRLGLVALARSPDLIPIVLALVCHSLLLGVVPLTPSSSGTL